MNRILVLGGSGFVGKASIESLIARNCGEIHAVYYSRKPQFNKEVILHKANLFNYKEVENLFSLVAPTHLIQTAWCADHSTYWKDVANLDWVTNSFVFAQHFIKNGGKRCLFIGTSAEYDWSVGKPLNEFTTPLIPQLLYGSAKLGLYWSLRRFFEQEGVSMVWGRLFNPFGPGEDRRRLIPKTCLRLSKGEKIQFDAALSLRDFLHIEEVGSAIAVLLMTEIEGAVNIASGQPVAVREVVSQIAASYGCTNNITFAASDTINQSPDIVVADVQRLNNECGFHPQKNFSERLQETCQWWAEYAVNTNI